MRSHIFKFKYNIRITANLPGSLAYTEHSLLNPPGVAGIRKGRSRLEMSAEPPYLSGDCPVEEQGRSPGRVMAGMRESHAKTRKETRK